MQKGWQTLTAPTWFAQACLSENEGSSVRCFTNFIPVSHLSVSCIVDIIEPTVP